jgi:hypothetical protein
MAMESSVSRGTPAKAASKSPKELKKLSSETVDEARLAESIWSYTVQVFSSKFPKNAEDIPDHLREKEFSMLISIHLSIKTTVCSMG